MRRCPACLSILAIAYLLGLLAFVWWFARQVPIWFPA
jgi:hypothetical protein